VTDFVAMDNSTGLPALPEGMFWRVKYEPLSYIAYFGHPTGDHTVLELVMKTIFYPPPQEYKRLFRKTEYIQPEGQPSTEVIKRRILETYDHVAGETRKAEKHEVTSDLIKETAIEMWINYNKEREFEKLLGDYPPKSL
jgi:hypothetical protein